MWSVGAAAPRSLATFYWPSPDQRLCSQSNQFRLRNQSEPVKQPGKVQRGGFTTLRNASLSTGSSTIGGRCSAVTSVWEEFVASPPSILAILLTQQRPPFSQSQTVSTRRTSNAASSSFACLAPPTDPAAIRRDWCCWSVRADGSLL